MRASLYLVAAYVVLFALLIATDLMRISTVPPLWDSPVLLYSSLVIGLVGAAFRDRNIKVALTSLTLGAVLGLLYGGTIAMFIFTFEAFFVATLGGTRYLKRIAELAGIALTVITVGTAWLATQEFRVALLFAMQAVITFWLPIEWADNVRKARELAELEKARAAVVLRNAEQARELAVARERTRMASELHDTVSGNLSAITLQSQAALATADDATREATLRAIRRESVEALAHMRSLITVLSGDRLVGDGLSGLGSTGPESSGQGLSGQAEVRAGSATDVQSAGAGRAEMAQNEPIGGLADLDALAGRARAAGHRVSLDVAASPTLDRVRDAGLYRMASEAITNAMRHAPGQPIDISTRADGRTLEVRVRNRMTSSAGAAGPAGAETPVGHGLHNLAVRAEHMGAEVSAGPDPADPNFWLVHVQVPYRQTPATTPTTKATTPTSDPASDVRP